MRWLMILSLMISSFAYAGEVNTECAYINDSSAKSSKVEVKSISSKAGSVVRK